MRGNTLGPWFDDFNHMHIRMYPEPGQTENSPLFTAEYLLLRQEVYHDSNILDVITSLWSFYNFKTKRFHANPLEEGPRFSHDNLTGIASIAAKFDIKIPYLNQWWSEHPHPRDLIFYGYIDGNYLAKLAIPLLIPIHIISCLAPKEDTSGRMLALTRNLALKDKSWIMRLNYRICNWLINRQYLQGWASVAAIYFKADGHPIRELCLKLQLITE